MLILILVVLLFVVVIVNISSYRDSLLQTQIGGSNSRTAVKYPLDKIDPLDLKSLQLAYSVHHLRKSYDGPILTVKRESDEMEKDFFPHPKIYSALYSKDGEELADWIAGTVGLVTVLYDQGLYGNHALSAQPNHVARVEYDPTLKQYWLRTKSGRLTIKDELKPLEGMTGITYVANLILDTRRRRMAHPLHFRNANVSRNHNPHIQWSNGSVYEWLGFRGRQRFNANFSPNQRHWYTVKGIVGDRTVVRLDGNEIRNNNFGDSVKNISPGVLQSRSTDAYRLDTQVLFNKAVSDWSLNILEGNKPIGLN